MGKQYMIVLILFVMIVFNIDIIYIKPKIVNIEIISW